MFGSNRKDVAFFDAFSAHAEQTVTAAKLLATMMKKLEGGDASAEELVALSTKVKGCETAGDTITHQTMKRLRENWITPLDRADIHDLMSALDDVLDFIDEAADRSVLFAVKSAPADARELSEILVRSCESMAKAVTLLRDMKHATQIREHCVAINELENDADRIYRRALAALFRADGDAEPNPLVIMKWRDIFESLESAVDRCEDVANVVEGVVLEYG